MSEHTIQPEGITAGPPSRPIWREPLVLVLAGIFLLVIVANGIMLRTALVTLAWNAFDLNTWCTFPIYAQTDRPDATAWRVTVTAPLDGEGGVFVHAVDETDAPISELWVAAIGFGPGANGVGVPLAVDEMLNRPGAYQVRLPRQWEGLWRLELTLTKGLLYITRSVTVQRFKQQGFKQESTGSSRPKAERSSLGQTLPKAPGWLAKR